MISHTNRKFLLILYLQIVYTLIVSTDTFAQTKYKEINISNDTSLVITSITEFNFNYYAVGFKLKLSDIEKQKKQVLIKLNNNLDQIWVKELRNGELLNIYSNANNFVVTGKLYDSLGEQQAYTAKTDTLGNIIWENKDSNIGLKNTSYFSTSINDTILTLSSMRKLNDSLRVSILYTNSTGDSIRKLDFTPSILNKIYTGTLCEVNNIKHLNKQTFVTGRFDVEGFISKINLKENKVQTFSYYNYLNDNSVHTKKITDSYFSNNEHCFLSQLDKYYLLPNFQTKTVARFGLIITDTLFRLKSWIFLDDSTDYYRADELAFESKLIPINNDFIFGGNYNWSKTFGDYPNSDFFISSIKNDGSKKWKIIFEYPLFQTMYSYIKCNDESILMCGYTRENNGKLNGFLVKTDSIKYLSTNSQNAFQVLRISPNPSENFININNAEINEFDFKIYDLLGNIVISKQNNIESIIDISDLSNGLFIIEISCNKLFYRGKFIKK